MLDEKQPVLNEEEPVIDEQQSIVNEQQLIVDEQQAITNNNLRKRIGTSHTTDCMGKCNLFKCCERNLVFIPRKK